tara:strand:- start:4443 stop:4907 length:465 start_codon:yes stop_codon:yes gene_type:complete
MYEYNSKIIRIVDGDTVDVDINLGFGVVFANQRIRLYGIDTPESRTRDPVEKIFGKTAAKFLESKLGEKCILRTRLDNKGKYGRILGEFVVYDEVTDSYMTVNDIMIRDYYAVEYYGQSKNEIEDEHLKNRDLLIEKMGLDDYSSLIEEMKLDL